MRHESAWVWILAGMLLIPGVAGAQQRGDSVSVRKAAERAQVRFERIRKLNPPRRDSGPRGECDARIGRFCHWNSADDTVVAPEPESVRRAKQSLPATLDTLSGRSPRDGWITGQRIRYLIESGDDSTAVTVARGAVSTALPGTAVQRGKTGFYWEIYGLAVADSVLPVSLTLTPAGQSVIRRIGESIGLARRITPLNIAWRDSPAMGGVSSRSVVLDLSLVPRGKYVLRVEARPDGKPQVGSSRAIELQ